MPFIPYFVGAAVGAAIVYIAKDDSSKNLLKDTGGKIVEGAGVVTDKITGIFKKDDVEVTTTKEVDTEEAVA